MSKEAVRKLVEGRFASFTFEGIESTDKSYSNLPKQPIPTSGRWLKLHNIEFVIHRVASLGSDPCTRRTGVIVIDAFERLDMGTKRIFELTDALEEWFFPFEALNFWTAPANTVNFPNDGDSNAHYRSRVYVPFTFDES